MSAKKDFTAPDTQLYSGMIGSINTGIQEEPKAEEGYEVPVLKPGRRSYARPGEQKKEYRFTCRMPAKCGLYLQERAWMTRRSITEVIEELVEADMQKHPEVFESLDKLNITK